MSDGLRVAASDLDPDYIGWLVDWEVKWPEGVFGPTKCEVVVVSLRSWTYDGTDHVGILGDGGRGRVEHHKDADTLVQVKRPVTPRAKRAARATGWREDTWVWIPPTELASACTTEEDADGDYRGATHPNHWARHGHPGRRCPSNGSCYPSDRGREADK